MTLPENKMMKTAINNKTVATNLVDESCKPLLDHLASELAKEYVRLIEQSADDEQCNNTENSTCVLQFMPATAQKANVKRA